MHPAALWKWPDYYWNLCKHFGVECYKTWRWELAASVLVVFFTALISGQWKDFRTALLATGLTLGCFAAWHLVRVPFVLHKSVHGQEQNEAPAPGNLAGIFGLIVIAGIFTGGYELALILWNAKPIGEIKSEFPLISPTIPEVATQPPNQQAVAPPVLPELITPPKHFIDKTPEQLIALYQGRTMLQADSLMQPYKRMWIKTEGKVLMIGPPDKGTTFVTFNSSGAPVECRFKAKWITPLARYDSGDTIKISGWIFESQNGQQLYLRDCELR